ncbi:MAG: hypothetical protein KJN81_10625 [Acidimicrobiia bacterium]|nr:hypothetical protein [Acidimicrobiia bacterium]NNL28869.1 hypothetical protein [Acidimicrobiia bacterium]
MKHLLAGALVVIASVAAGLFYPVSWIRGPMLDSDRAAVALDGLEQQPDVATALGTVAVTETLMRVDLETIARPIIGDLYDIVGGQAESFLTDTAIGVIASGQVAPLWRVLAGESFAELSSALGNVTEPTRPVGINLTNVADDLLTEFGLPSGLVPTADWRLELLQVDDLGGFRMVVQPAIQYGPWLPWLSLVTLFAAMAVTRSTFRTIGWWLVGAAAVTVGFTLWAQRLLNGRLAAVENVQNRRAFQVVVDALVDDGVTSSILAGTILGVLGLVVVVIGTASRRSRE